ncbi:MAG TPA: HAMP domain-containing histidine kinase [Thiothrix sp.]|nr:HAMP domain-containing histidine kinase [Thiothrix sp.]
MIQKLLSTTAFRLSLIYALLFSLIAAIALGIAYWLAAQLIYQQIDERLQLETNVLLSQYYSGNFTDLSRMISHRNSKDVTQFFIYALINRQQHDFFSDLPTASESEQHPHQATFATLPLQMITHDLPVNKQTLDTRVLLTPLPAHYQLLVGTDMSEAEKLLEHIASILLIAVLIIMTAALLGGWLMGQSVLKRVDRIHRTAKEIIEGDLNQRMPLQAREDEFNRLAKVVNEMLARLQTVMMSMRDVTNNLAHDLRNPLNRLHHRLEALRYLPPNSDKQQQELDNAVNDVSSLIATFNAILNIAQIESSVQRDCWEDIDMTHMIHELGELYTLVAEEKKISFHVYSEKHLILHADRQLIAQTITNLLDNAVKYTPAGGKIRLEAYYQSTHPSAEVIINVCDSGIGIPEADYQRVFERFTRLDTVRNTAGNGLGLSLVKAVMDLHQAKISLSDNQPGLCVKLSFFPIEIKSLEKNK